MELAFSGLQERGEGLVSVQARDMLHQIYGRGKLVKLHTHVHTEDTTQASQSTPLLRQ